MRRAQLFCLWLTMLIGLSVSAQTNISIYRNDGRFNQIKLTAGETVGHSISDGVPKVEVNDWISGPTAIPVEAIDSCSVRQSDIPVLRLSLSDYPDADMLWDKELYLNATLSIEGNGYIDDMPETLLQVKGRGNTTWLMPKKPIRLKFAKKTALCGMKKAKNFVLLNNYLDPSLMRNALAMWIARRLEMPYANSMIPCHVFINGHYAGAYTLTEKIGINSGSVDIDESEGILLELSTEFDEKYKFYSAILNLPVMVKDPDFDELFENNQDAPTPEERLKLWQDDFNRAEAMAVAGKGAEAFDIENFVNYFLLYNIVCNSDIGFPKSLYIHKKSLNDKGKYILGPAWDFDVAFNFTSFANGVCTTRAPEENLWIPSLIKYLIQTKEAQALYAEKWNFFKNEIFPELLAFLDNYAATIEPSAKINALRWPTTGNFYSWAYHLSGFDFHNHAAELRAWLEARVDFLDQE